MSDRFDELVDDPGLAPEERERLRRVHDLLVAAGPAPEPPAHLRPPLPAAVVPLRRRSRPLLLLAATLAAATAGAGGYVLGRDGGQESAPPAPATTPPPATTAPPPPTTQPEPPDPTYEPEPIPGRLVAMTGVGAASGASATVEILPRAESGDYPVRLRVEGLAEGEQFEMWIADDGRLKKLCGSFWMKPGVTDTVLSVPYEMRTRDEWVIVRPGSTEPLLRT
jgi:hypothetical protein